MTLLLKCLLTCIWGDINIEYLSQVQVLAEIPLFPMTYLFLGTSPIPISSTFQMLNGLYSNFHSLTHFLRSLKNLLMTTGFAHLAQYIDKFLALFSFSLGHLSRKPLRQYLPAFFFFRLNPGLLLASANSFSSVGNLSSVKGKLLSQNMYTTSASSSSNSITNFLIELEDTKEGKTTSHLQ